MNNSKEKSFQNLLQNYFQQRMIQQKRVSGRTIDSYKDTFKIYFKYLIEEHSVHPDKITLEYFINTFIEEFCSYLKAERNNSPKTINKRLAALHSFLKYVSEMASEYAHLIAKSLSVPFQKCDNKAMDFLTKDEFDVVLSLYDTTTTIISRDKLMFLILYNTGLRVSELVVIKKEDIIDLYNSNRTSLKIYGKGRKERVVPLWKVTAKYLLHYVDAFDIKDNGYLFTGKNNERLTRSGVRFRIDKYVNEASKTCNSLTKKKITPHIFRYSVAMNLLQAGIDISTIAIWLGHSSILTTHKYMVADIELKRKAMEKAGESGNSNMNYKLSNDILKFLESL